MYANVLNNKMETLLKEGETPNYTFAQVHIAMLEFKQEELSTYRSLLGFMEERLKLPKFEVNIPIEVQHFNATQILLTYAVEGVLSLEKYKEVRRYLEKTFGLLPLTAETVLECLESVRENAKPNFIQYQLKMYELGAVPSEWREMRHLMEKKLNLDTMDDCAPPVDKSDCEICKGYVLMGGSHCGDHR